MIKLKVISDSYTNTAKLTKEEIDFACNPANIMSVKQFKSMYDFNYLEVPENYVFSKPIHKNDLVYFNYGYDNIDLRRRFIECQIILKHTKKYIKNFEQQVFCKVNEV